MPIVEPPPGGLSLGRITTTETDLSGRDTTVTSETGYLLSIPDMPRTFEDVFMALFDEVFELLVERQRKYGPDNIRRLGLFGVFGRLADDKLERIRRALNGRVVRGVVVLDKQGADFDDESFEDALKDAANYCIIMLALWRGQWGYPLAAEVDGDAESASNGCE